MRGELTFSISVFTYNRNDDLLRCLKSLSEQSYSDFAIVVVNGGDYSGVKGVVDQFKDLKIRVVNQKSRGLVEARNIGWKNANADIVCLIDDDLVVSADWLENVRRTFLSDESIGGVTGPTIIPDDKQKNRDFALFLQEFKNSENIFLKLIGRVYIGIVLENKLKEVGKILKSGAFTPGSNYKDCLNLSGLIDVDYLEACHMCFRRKILEELKGFDYRYEGTSEWSEPDFAFKVKKLGYKLIFNPKTVTEHHISQSGVFKARTNAYERSRNFIYFYFQNIKPNNPNKILRFSINLCFINAYWCYRFVQTKNVNWLSGVTGTLLGLAKEILG